MKVLVFGKTGQVARELSRRSPEGWEMTTLGREDADLCDPESCAEAINIRRPDAVINAAAYTAVDRAETQEDLARRINAYSPAAMAQAAASICIPFLHISSDYVFDGASSIPQRPDCPTSPVNAYGRTKLAGEEAVRAAGGKYAILRTSWVFSSHGTNFVKTMLRLGREHDVLSIVSDQIGGPTPAADIASALVRMADCLTAESEHGGVFHFSGAPEVSWANFAREIFSQARISCTVREISTTEYPTPARRPANSRLDCHSLASKFGIERPDWRTGLAMVLQELEASA
ncbi:dTDP-4-dehydrorhamnose reductase [Pelagibacterium flavum]|uniref:dTDP-4-dehydrorhamnose reductase n=1 Tax=Pelagibacterium flavum TaxID=2984530 RepID=A0ABY6IT51_9HYPH|nr:dTDP-4-dehydrorhamnose reductase [Pelagibacterium sp. YIM 151497]